MIVLLGFFWGVLRMMMLMMHSACIAQRLAFLFGWWLVWSPK